MKLTRNSNPYKLKTKDEKGYLHEEVPSGYLNSEEFIDYLNKKKILFKRDDNLGRFCNNNSIHMVKIKREGRFGATPYAYKKPSENQIEQIKINLLNNNNSMMGKIMLKKKKEKILDIFDAAASALEYNKKIKDAENKGFDIKKISEIKKEKKLKCESKTSIAKKVSEILKVSCNRKLVASVLDEKRSSQINKLLKVE